MNEATKGADVRARAARTVVSCLAEKIAAEAYLLANYASEASSGKYPTSHEPAGSTKAAALTVHGSIDTLRKLVERLQAASSEAVEEL